LPENRGWDGLSIGRWRSLTQHRPGPRTGVGLTQHEFGEEQTAPTLHSKIGAPSTSFSTINFSPRASGAIFRRRHSSPNKRSVRFVVRVERRCVTSRRRRFDQDFEVIVRSSFTAVGKLSVSAMMSERKSRAIAREGAELRLLVDRHLSHCASGTAGSAA
jgi:thymidylate synthase ThyX